MYQTKKIGNVDLEKYDYDRMPGQVEVRMAVEMNGKFYQYARIIPVELWNETDYLKSLVRDFLTKASMQEYKVDTYKGLTVEQKEFLPDLERYAVKNDLEDEVQMIDNIMDKGGYSDTEKQILNILREKYIEDNEQR